MKFDMKKPCDNCPFRITGGIRLTPDRAEEIAYSQVDGQGATFTCHKTTVACDGQDEEGECEDGPNAQYCAGAMAFTLNVGTANQMLRIASRTGWDHTKVETAGVFDSVEAMVEAQEPNMRRYKKRKRARR